MNFIFLTFSSKCKNNGSRAKLTWHPLGVTYFARDTLHSYFDECQKIKIDFLIKRDHNSAIMWFHNAFSIMSNCVRSISNKLLLLLLLCQKVKGTEAQVLLQNHELKHVDFQ